MLGRSSLRLVLRGEEVGKPLCSVGGGLGEETDTTDDKLFETEWPWRIVIVLEASLETSDSGRGMNSRVSEKPTLPAFLGGVASLFCPPSVTVFLEDVADSSTCVTSAAVVGVLPVVGKGGTSSLGLTKNERSPQEIAAERL